MFRVRAHTRLWSVLPSLLADYPGHYVNEHQRIEPNKAGTLSSLVPVSIWQIISCFYQTLTAIIPGIIFLLLCSSMNAMPIIALFM
jgi:hypothetical protein